jgi:hypothetical protein
MTSFWHAFGKLLISAIVVVILSTQLIAGFGITGRWGWPLLNYPMYNTARFEGDRLNHEYEVYAVLSDTTRTKVVPADVGMDHFHIFRANVVMSIRDKRLHLLAPVLRHYCEKHDDRVTKLQVEDVGVAIGRDGPVEGLPTQVFWETAVSCQ